MNLNLYEKINFFHWCELTTEYEECQKPQLSTVDRYQHNTHTAKYRPIIVIEKIPKNIEILFFFNIAHP